MIRISDLEEVDDDEMHFSAIFFMQSPSKKTFFAEKTEKN